MAIRELHITSKGVDHVCMIDESDYDLVSRYRWNISNGYAKSGKIMMHRLIVGVKDSHQYIDHIDHNTLNNTRSNLRTCTKSENQHNRRKQKSTSRLKGVTRYARGWLAQIRVNNEYIYLGYFRSEITAGKAYDRASMQHHGKYGLRNFDHIEVEPMQLGFQFREETGRRASIQLIRRAIKEGWIKQLAFYHLLKYRFNNSCIYAYRSRMDELAEQLGISTKTLYNYLDVLRAKDLIHEHEHNLILKSIRKYGKKKIILSIDNNHDLFDLTCLLYEKLIYLKAKQQAFAESVRRFGRGDKFIDGLSENSFRPSFSCRTTAKLLNTSESKAFRIIHNLNKLNIIRTTKPKPVLISKNFTHVESIEDLPGYRFNIGTRLFQVYGMQFEFLQYPVKLKKITPKQYKLIHKHL